MSTELVSLTITDGDQFELVVQELEPIELAIPEQLVIIGNGVASGKQFTAFPTPSATWLVNHNLGYVPDVFATDMAGNLLWVALNITTTQITATFAAPTTGIVYYS